MSACISQQGEFSDHVLPPSGRDRFTCTRCGVLDEERLLDAAEEAERLRTAHHLMSEQFKVMQREKEHGWHLAEKAESERDALRAELDALRGRVAALADRMTIELAGDIERRDEAGHDDHDYWNGVVGGSAWQAQALRNLLNGQP